MIHEDGLSYDTDKMILASEYGLNFISLVLNVKRTLVKIFKPEELIKLGIKPLSLGNISDKWFLMEMNPHLEI